jgi:uncharacterized protein (TIGR03437 family)
MPNAEAGKLSKMRTYCGTIGLLVLFITSVSGQVCYQFSGSATTDSPTGGSFTAQVNIANPQNLTSVTAGFSTGSFGGPGNSVTATIGQSTQVVNQLGVVISVSQGNSDISTLLNISGAGISPPASITIQLGGPGNLLPLGLPVSLPSISSWTSTKNFGFSTGSTIFFGTINFVGACGSTPPPVGPSITSNGIVPVYSTSGTVESGEWVSIYGTNLATTTAIWNGDFPTTLGGTSVTIDGKAAYLWYVSPTQINLQVPDDDATGSVPVAVTTPNGSASSTVTLAQFAPAFSLLDAHHVAGIIIRTDGSGAYGGGTYDILGPTGNSLGYPTVAAKPGDAVTLFAVGLGPTNPHVPAGQPFSGSAPTTNPVSLLINNSSVQPTYSGETSAGLYQLNLTIPANSGVGDLPLQASVGGAQTQAGVVIALDAASSTVAKVKDVTLASLAAGSGAPVSGTVDLSAPAPGGGAMVALSSSGGVSLPASVLIPAGSTSATFGLTTQTVASTQTVIITATYGGISVQTALTVTPATADSPFVQLTVVPMFQPAGYPSISTATFTVTPDPGNATFTACIDGCDSGTVLPGGTVGNQGQTFTFSTIRAGRNSVLFSGSSNSLLAVTSASLTFTLARTVTSGKIALGTVTGTLTLIGSTPQNPAITLSGPITGNYAETLP